jgi:hypothetical protein
MPIKTPEFYTQLGESLLKPQQWQSYYEPDPFAFIVQNLIAALMIRKGIRQRAIRDFMDWMTSKSPDVAVQWLKIPTFREFIKKQTGMKEKDLQRLERAVEEWQQIERETIEAPRQAPPPTTSYPPFILPEGEPRTPPPMPATEVPAVVIPPEENYPVPAMPTSAPTMGFVPPRGRIPFPTIPLPFPFSFPLPLVLYWT